MEKFRINDMVKIGSHDCKGCHECCTGMGDSIILDPYDLWNLENNLKTDFEKLITDGIIELNVHDGVVLPNIKMNTFGCSFLNNGRCQIHDYRPGICRLFPLGREYTENSLMYFLLEEACPHADIKVKIKNWINVQNYMQYEQYLIDFHNLKKKLIDFVISSYGSNLEEVSSKISAFVRTFYYLTYSDFDFYEQFYDRYNFYINHE